MAGKRYRKGGLIQDGNPSAEPRPATISRIQAEYFSGPLPHPSLLAKYNEVVPNGAERILAMAEKQSAHRESLEATVVNGNLEMQKRGSNRAFILALVIIVGGIYLMATGRDAWGFAAIITSLVSLVSVFAISRSRQKIERAKKEESLESRH